MYFLNVAVEVYNFIAGQVVPYNVQCTLAVCCAEFGVCIVLSLIVLKYKELCVNYPNVIWCLILCVCTI